MLEKIFHFVFLFLICSFVVLAEDNKQISLEESSLPPLSSDADLLFFSESSNFLGPKNKMMILVGFAVF